MKSIRIVQLAFIVALFSFGLPLWAVWEGNAGIASESEFPSPGLYARSDMFPKNTIVDIKNLETEISVRVVITGSAGVPGLVAVLSPETARALSVRTGSVSRVRISIPSIVSEKPASGTISSGSALTNTDPDSNPAAAVAEILGPDFVPDSKVLTEAPAEIAEAPAEITEAPAEITEAPAEIAEAPAEIAEAPAEITEAPAEITEAPAEIAEAPQLSEPPTAIVTAPVSEYYYSEPELTLTPEEVEEPAFEIADVPTEIAEAPTEVSDDVLVTLVPAAEKPPLAPVEPIESKNIPYVGAIIEKEDTSKVQEPIEEVVIVDPIVAPVVAIPSVAAVAPVEAVAPTIQPTAVEVEKTSSINLPFLSSFIPGSFYIQIASYKDPKNAEAIVQTYGATYPVLVEKSPSTSGELLKVYIGPVQKDEYGAVLERFKNQGFKDAFVKKIK